jgi:uncharacterized membrane protein
MSVCSDCGVQLPGGAYFCPGCGSAVYGVSVGDAPETPGPTVKEAREAGAMPIVASTEHFSGEELPIPENIAAVVAYMTVIPAIVFLFLEPFKRNLFVRFHAFQHLFLWLAGFAFGIAAVVLWTVLQLIPFMRVLVFPFAGLIGLAWFFVWVLLVVKAYHHEMFKLPVVGDLAEAWSQA